MARLRSCVRLGAALTVSVLLLVLGLPLAAQAAPNPVTITKMANLGFTASEPVSVDTGVANPPCLFSIGACVFHGAAAFSGTLNVDVSLEAEVALTYDSSDLNTSNAPLPVSVKYTPVVNGSTVTYGLSGTATFNFDTCSNCPAMVPLSATSTPTTFTAPMGTDSPITIPGSSTGITLSAGGIPVITATLGGGLTLAPAPAGLLPGLGGAAALVQVTGASGAPTLPIEWDTSGSSQNFTLTTPATPTPLGISLGPIFHWLSTSGNAQINLHWSSDIQNIVAVLADIASAGVCLVVNCSISDPSPISLFSGGLGPVYSSAGLDTEIGNAIGPPAGSLVASRVALGFVPIPLTSPAHTSIPPLNTGTLDFAVPSVAIAGAPAGTVLQGDSINLAAAASGGTAPFTYAWTKNGAPFATTQGITDTPALGDTTYGVTVTDSQGAVSNTATTVVHDYDFGVADSPTSLQALTTGTNTFGATETLTPGSSNSGLPSIGLSLSGLPSGASANFSPASGSAAGFSSTGLITTTGAPAGTYGLTLTGTDARVQIGGSRSTPLSLTILTPAQAIPNVIGTVQGLRTTGVLNGGQTNSLTVKLSHAIASLTSNPPSQPPACNQLQSFVNEVNSYVSTGILTQAQANTLLGGPLGIFAIMAAIPC